MDSIQSRWVRREPPPDERQRAHAVVFSQPRASVAAARALKRDGYRVVEAYTPFAVHGMDAALGMKETRLPWATFAGGVFGGIVGLGFPIWTHATDWPLNIGGKPFIAWEAIVPVAFEVVVLFAAFATLGALFTRSRLKPPGHAAAPPSQPLPGVTDDLFVLIVAEEDGDFEWDRFERRCRDLGAGEIREGWRVS